MESWHPAKGKPVQANDLLVMLGHNSVRDVMDGLALQITDMFENRHNYPMWPIHGDEPVDDYEEAYHGPMRQVYYMSTLQLVHTMRALRTLL